MTSQMILTQGSKHNMSLFNQKETKDVSLSVPRER